MLSTAGEGTEQADLLNSATGLSVGIGPNAILQVLDLAERWYGTSTANALSAGLLPCGARPQSLVPEALVAQLHHRVVELLDPNEAYKLLHHAGEQTAQYLLAHRIPKPAQWLMKKMPRFVSGQILTAAISRNAWTFVGSGQFSARYTRLRTKPAQRGWCYRIASNPLAKGLNQKTVACWFYTAVFQTLFQVLVHPAIRVVETQCMARGDAYCEFEFRKV